MEEIRQALENLNRSMSERDHRGPIPFDEFLREMMTHPHQVIRNVTQVFHDMIRTYVGEGIDEYPDDPESISFVYFDCTRLFVEGSDHPFFADRLFANRLFNHIEAMRRGAQQNKLYIFEGPPGCGKSTFLNNLLMKFEEYANTENGSRYEVVWRLDRRALGLIGDSRHMPAIERFLGHLLTKSVENIDAISDEPEPLEVPIDFAEVPCASHDNPLLVIPKNHRRVFFDDMFKNNEFKWKLFTEKEYEWVFRDNPCTICSSLYDALLTRLQSPKKVFEMLYARKYHFNRRIGEGISVFNPGDKPMKETVLSNQMLQERIDTLLHDSGLVRYLFSHYAKTNNGIYALMDIKSNNTERLIELHNIISEGVHKVDDVEENVNSLFLALMNPEDKMNIQGIQSFSDRIEYIKVPYVLDLNTEVEIYKNIFGKHIVENFLPRVLHNFARIIISTRLNIRSEALLEWIGDAGKYRLYCDENLMLLKMEIYTGHIPQWLTDEDRKGFNAKRRRRIIAESETEGDKGLSGRDSIKIFDEFYSTYFKEGTPINMSMLYSFFTNVRKDLGKSIPKGFMESVLRMYDYMVLQEVKESLYYYNDEQISRDILNYIFACNFEPGTVEKCKFTGDRLEITEEFFDSFERRILGSNATERDRLSLRRDTQREYTSRTLTQEMMLEGREVPQTELFKSLFERYVQSLKERALDPFLENENFRAAIKDFDTDTFKTFDERIQEDVTFLMTNLCKKHRYTQQGAREVCIYVIDNDLARKFGKK